MLCAGHFSRICVFAGLAIGACEPRETTHVEIVLDADAAALAGIESLFHEAGGADGPSGSRLLALNGPDASALPVRFSIVPKNGDAGRRWWVTAELRDEAGAVRSRLRAEGGFRDGERLEYRLFFTEACDGVLCRQPSTCAEGACRPACVAPNEGGTTTVYEPCPNTADGGMPPLLESLRNDDPLFRRYEDASAQEIDALGFANANFTEPNTGAPDNGASPAQGQFRVACQWSHFGYDDPIVARGDPGASYLHMYFGNTRTDAFTVFHDPPDPDDPHDLLSRGGGTCQGFELDRSAYWIPALIDESTGVRRVVIPDEIFVYHLSNRPTEVTPPPRGLELLTRTPGAPAPQWACSEGGATRATIPTDCAERIIGSVSFPPCVAVDGSDDPVLRSPDHVAHTSWPDETGQCPTSHPHRIPDMSLLIVWPNGTDDAGAGVSTWRLDSDTGSPGGSLQAGWIGGWNEETSRNWIEGCFDPSRSREGPRNCSQGQTGPNGTGRMLRRVSELNDYPGENFRVLPQ